MDVAFTIPSTSESHLLAHMLLERSKQIRNNPDTIWTVHPPVLDNILPLITSLAAHGALLVLHHDKSEFSTS